jgi:hypothetical protein
MRSCSQCNTFMSGRYGTQSRLTIPHLLALAPRSSAAPSMCCPNCNHTFCFVHGDSHPGKSCSHWARENLESERETERIIKSLSKPCPGCRVATQKSAGCNHMKCTQCKTEWPVPQQNLRFL